MNHLAVFCLAIGVFTSIFNQNVELVVRDACTGELIKGSKVTQITTYPPTEFWGEGRTEEVDLVEDGNHMFHTSYKIRESGVSGITAFHRNYYREYLTFPNAPFDESNALSISLMPKICPLPLVARRLENAHLAYTGEASVMRYDCFVADWLPPYGKGKVPDLEFSMNQNGRNQEIPYILSIRFMNPNDGFMRITEKYATQMVIREAPEALSLINSIDLPIYSDYTKLYNQSKQKYVFRVRTQQSNEGEVISAFYGKLYNAFKLHIRDSGIDISFFYFLNPSQNNRNLEYNGKSLNNVPHSWERIKRAM